MTCKTENGQKVFHCDTCADHIETECEEFKMAIITMKRHGWKTYTGPDNDYAHACPACVEKFRDDQRAKEARR